MLANCDDSATKELLVASGWGEQRVPEEQLYDLLLDPNEGRDLSSDPAHAEVLTELRERLDEWMVRTDDPLREGPIVAPPGAVTNDPSQGSPNEPWQAAEPAILTR